MQSAERKLEQTVRVKEEADSGIIRSERDALTRELKERDYELEERENQISELHNRLEQSRRMYDAMKMLLDERESSSSDAVSGGFDL